MRSIGDGDPTTVLAFGMLLLDPGVWPHILWSVGVIGVLVLVALVPASLLLLDKSVMDDKWVKPGIIFLQQSIWGGCWSSCIEIALDAQTR